MKRGGRRTTVSTEHFGEPSSSQGSTRSAFAFALFTLFTATWRTCHNVPCDGFCYPPIWENYRNFDRRNRACRGKSSTQNRLRGGRTFSRLNAGQPLQEVGSTKLLCAPTGTAAAINESKHEHTQRSKPRGARPARVQRETSHQHGQFPRHVRYQPTPRVGPASIGKAGRRAIVAMQWCTWVLHL